MEKSVDVKKIGVYSRQDKYLYAIATEDISRAERYFKYIALNGNASGEHMHRNKYVLDQLTQEHIDAINTIFEEVQG